MPKTPQDVYGLLKRNAIDSFRVLGMSRPLDCSMIEGCAALLSLQQALQLPTPLTLYRDWDSTVLNADTAPENWDPQLLARDLSERPVDLWRAPA